jgi:hypothetical protein
LFDIGELMNGGGAEHGDPVRKTRTGVDRGSLSGRGSATAGLAAQMGAAPDFSAIINAANAARQAVVAAFTNMQIQVAQAVSNTVTSAGGAFAGLSAALVNPANSARQAVVAAFTNMQIQAAQAMTNTVTSASTAFQAIVMNLTNSANTASQAVHAAFVNMQINVAAVMVAFVTNASTQALMAGQLFNTNLTQGLTAAAANVLIQTAQMVSSLTNFQTQASARGLAAGQSFNQGLTQGMNAAVANTQIAMSRIQSAMNIGSQHSVGFGIGSSLGAGINAGIAFWTSAIAATASAAVSNAVAAARAAAGIASPSKVMMQLGADLMRGATIGVDRQSAQFSDAMRHSSERAIGAFNRNANAHMNMAHAARNGGMGGVTHNHYYVVKSGEMVQIIKGAEQGKIAHAQMSPRGRELSLGLRGV